MPRDFYILQNWMTQSKVITKRPIGGLTNILASNVDMQIKVYMFKPTVF